jgi:hypothetical protein
MNLTVLLPALTSILAIVFSLFVLDQWIERRRPYQLVWTLGMLFFGIASGCEALAAASGWSEPLYRTWYLTGVVWTAGWLGLGTAFLLGRTRFGYTFAGCILFAGLIMFALRNSPRYADAGSTPILYFIAALVLALAIGVETYFANERWPRIAALAVVGATALSIVLMLATALPAPGYAIDLATGAPTAELLPGSLRLLTPFMNVTGAAALVLGAIFSTYVFMPKRRILDYSLDPNQPGDQFLFNLLISPVAIVVNLVASIPLAVRAFLGGRMNSRAPATALIALGGLIPAVTDSLNRVGSTDFYQLGKLLGVILLFAGFLVSTEVFREVRIPFTHIRLRAARNETSAEASTD